MSRPRDISIRYLKGIGPARAKIFSRAGINSIEDLLYHFPRRYEDRTRFSPISALQEGQPQTIQVRVLSCSSRSALYRRGFSITEVTAGDSTGRLNCVWFNQPYLKEYFKAGATLILYGKVERRGRQLQMNSPEFEITEEADTESKGAAASLHIGRIVPIYSLPERVSQRHFRQLVHFALNEYLPRVTDCLSFEIRQRNKLLNIAASLRQIHFPENLQSQKEAYRRLAFEEFFLFQLPVALRKLRKKEKPGIAHKTEGGLAQEFIARLPFQLTPAQAKALAEIKEDMARPFAMQRLLQGDVGSGKTVVAVIASLVAVQGGYQAGFMVPTEILARQHYEKIKNQISKIKNVGAKINLGLLTGNAAQKEKEKIYKEIKEGKIDLIIGTHALLEENVRFKNLGLVVIDEQHKFGVGQRALLPEKGANPDILIMTATPIPRTLAITLYADLDISVIKELPAGRRPIRTEWLAEEKRDWLYEFMRNEIARGRQAYIVYPVIEESAALDLSGARKMYAQLKRDVFGPLQMGLLHGRLKQKEQERIMSEFVSGKIKILVATTVLEVGIDVANATLMVVEHAERFGLSQLHQLRGRIGRGKEESFCFLFSGAPTEEAGARLEAMVKYSDGFYIAEEDLRIRGPGEFFGRRQHGLSELKIANPLAQMQLLKIAREEAVKLAAQDPRLEKRPNVLLKEKLLQKFPEYEKLIVVG